MKNAIQIVGKGAKTGATARIKKKGGKNGQSFAQSERSGQASGLSKELAEKASFQLNVKLSFADTASVNMKAMKTASKTQLKLNALQRGSLSFTDRLPTCGHRKRNFSKTVTSRDGRHLSLAAHVLPRTFSKRCVFLRLACQHASWGKLDEKKLALEASRGKTGKRERAVLFSPSPQ